MEKCFFYKFLFFLLLFVFPNTNTHALENTDYKKEKAYQLIAEGNKAEKKNNFFIAEEKYYQTLTIWNDIKEYDEYRAYPFYSLATLYRKMGNYKKSLDNYYEAEKILLLAHDEFKFLLSAIYSSMGSLFSEYGDYTKALLYYNKSLKVVEDSKIINEQTYSNAKIHIAQTYYYQRKYQQSIEFCKEYISTHSSVNKSRFERLMGSCLIELGRYEEAKEILEKSLAGFKNLPERYTEAFLITTKAYLKSYNLATTEEYLKKALPLLEANKPPSDPWRIYYYELTGEFFMKKAEQSDSIPEKQTYLNEAVRAIDKALIINSESTEKNKIPYVETEGNFIVPTQVKDLLINRSRALNEIAVNYTKSGDKISAYQFQQFALASWEATVRFLHDFRISFLEEESQLLLSELQINVYFEGFSLAGKLFKSTGDEKYFQKMLFFSESAKSSTFMASLNVAQAKNFGGIPDTLLQKEKELTQQLSAITQLIYNTKNSNSADSVIVKQWVENQFNLQKQHDELMFRFENEFPNYYKFKYSNKIISTNEVAKKMKKDQSLIEYFVDEPLNQEDKGSINILYFSKNKYEFYTKEINYDYVIHLENILGQLMNQNVGETTLEDFKSFIKSSRYLYSVLIEPIKFSHSVSDLIIIPDGKLSYLSFDALISEQPDTLHFSFSSPNYLIKRYNFVYSYSATLHFEYFRNGASMNSNILAFAPNYSGNEVDINKAAYRARQVSRTLLRPLPGAREEVIGLAKHYNSNAFIGDSATETNFKRQAGNYGILHLAMHTMLNDSIPMYSKLVFSASSDSTEDGFLNTQEIYNMKLNARLAVLSACKTGYGKMRTGEGVMSMARSFLYAGCPSIVMTLWEVEDKSSADLVLNFYRNLFKGHTKPEALRRSKLHYLKNADPLKSHPYFWMGYIVVGDPSPIKYHTSVVISIIVFAFVIVVILFLRKELSGILEIDKLSKFSNKLKKRM